MFKYLPLVFFPIPEYVLGLFICNIFFFSYIFHSYLPLPVSFGLVFFIIWILFLYVNPYDKGQNKYTILENIPSKFIPPMTMVNDMNPDNITFPLILKPVICTKTGNQVYKIDNFEELKSKNFDENYMIQGYSPYDREVGILYERFPWEKNGKIISIVEKLGTDHVRKWCFGDYKCQNRKDLITDKLEFVIDSISKLIPNFYVGRYDIRFKDDDSFSQGENFHIVEVNGTLGFDLAKGTEEFAEVSLLNHRWFWSRLIIGAYNIINLRGYSPGNLLEILAITLKNAFECKDWEKLYSLYT